MTNGLRGIRVLLAENEADIRDLLITLLQLEGAQITVVQMGYEVIERVSQDCPNLLICNISLPDMDGYSILQLIRSLDSATARSLPAIAIGSGGMFIDTQQARAAGFDAIVDGAIDPAQFIETLQALVRG